jgi:hypothetical protein
MKRLLVKRIVGPSTADVIDMSNRSGKLMIKAVDSYVFASDESRDDLITSFRAGRSPCPVFVGDWVICDDSPTSEFVLGYLILNDGDRRKCLF